MCLGVFVAIHSGLSGLGIHKMKCPLCGCVSFYIKDPDDEYETYEFAWRDGNVEFSADVDQDSCPEVCDDTEIFCDQCSWHGETQTLEDSNT